MKTKLLASGASRIWLGYCIGATILAALELAAPPRSHGGWMMVLMAYGFPGQLVGKAIGNIFYSPDLGLRWELFLVWSTTCFVNGWALYLMLRLIWRHGKSGSAP